ncbi:MAG: glycerophosphodiester phosphodiesterase [Gammaproteobacteria bacterium]|nr:MAG: glycerophosphodiester phosphodiesterase [Gammaproteobacteria bacterium]RLA15072.1 MAG: glycerophosphodiester phosphodiesterase [Gammaproteobacteria bacterium]
MPKPAFLCIGHRGAMGHAPENTLASVRKALALGAEFIEMDVYWVDDQLMVFHDDRLERTTNGSGYLWDQSFELLRSLDAGDGEQIPTLDEVCKLIDQQAGLNIELKGPGTAAPVAAFINDLALNGWQQTSLLVSSFDHRQLAELKQLNPNIRLGALTASLPVDNARFAESLGAYSVHASLDFIDQVFVTDAHARGIKVYVYTVNYPEDIARMRQLGVDGVFTNFPERVLNDGPVPSA